MSAKASHKQDELELFQEEFYHLQQQQQQATGWYRVDHVQASDSGIGSSLTREEATEQHDQVPQMSARLSRVSRTPGCSRQMMAVQSGGQRRRTTSKTTAGYETGTVDSGGTAVARQPMRISRVLGPSNATTLALRRNEQVTVFIHVVFLKIGEIDTAKEKYAADVFIQARWREPLFDKHIDMKPEEITWSKYWNPQLYVDNVAGDPKETIWRTVMWKNRKEAFVFERRRVAGLFVENLNLFQFPFDTQDLTLTLVSERLARELTLVEDSGELSTVNVQSFVNEQEWRLYNNVETQQQTVTRIYQDDESTHPSFTAVCHASRRFGFYFWNILFVMFFICSMTFTTFAVDIKKPENRLQLTFILLLTSITFKFAVNQSLPKLSYLTHLDKYVLSSMALMCAICVWHAGIPFINSELADKCVLSTFGVLYIIAHVAFCLRIYLTAFQRRKQCIADERKHIEKLMSAMDAEDNKLSPAADDSKFEPEQEPFNNCRSGKDFCP